MQTQFELRYTQGYATPPQELFVDISVDKLLLQFSRLRSWLQSLEQAPYGHEFYEPKILSQDWVLSGGVVWTAWQCVFRTGGH